MIYFVVGPSGVGKTSFSNLLKRKRNVKIFDTGPILRNIYIKGNYKISFGEWVKCGEDKYGDNYAITLICNEIRDIFKNNSDTIIIGNRCIDGIKYTIESLNIYDYIIIYFDASFDCLKTNYEKREKIKITDNDFYEIIEGGNKMGLLELKRYVLENSKHYYYFKNDNNDLNYLNIFDNISKKRIKRS